MYIVSVSVNEMSPEPLTQIFRYFICRHFTTCNWPQTKKVISRESLVRITGNFVLPHTARPQDEKVSVEFQWFILVLMDAISREPLTQITGDFYVANATVSPSHS